MINRFYILVVSAISHEALRILSSLWVYLLLIPTTLIWGSNDLEEYSQDFIQEVKKIEISGYPHAFNPSIVRWQGRLLMSFRIINDPQQPLPIPSSGESNVGLVWLDEDFNPEGKVHILEWHDGLQGCSEDGRLLSIEDHFYLIYSGHNNSLENIKDFFIYVAELSYDGIDFHVLKSECMSEFEGKIRNRREKNWVPFVYADKLHFAYQLTPHKILCPILDGSGRCQTAASTFPSIVWEWGELRGGTQGLPLDEQVYLSFFHSSIIQSSLHSNEKSMPHYYMGAYTFSRTPPFEIRKISPEPIVGKKFYNGTAYSPYWHPVQVVFPCGFIINETTIWVTYGRQDHECWVVKLDKKGLLESLIQVSNFD